MTQRNIQDSFNPFIIMPPGNAYWSNMVSEKEKTYKSSI